MRLLFLTFLTMMAFAGNSLLTRAALSHLSIDPGNFASIRLFSGALVLNIALAVQSPIKLDINKRNVFMALALLLYMVGFSYAYLSLDAGLGALILFGGVQLTMLIGMRLSGAQLTTLQILGALIAFAGLLILFLPSQQQIHVPITAGLMMSAAAIGWGTYSLLGKKVENALASTAQNFTLAFPLCLLIAIFMPDWAETTMKGVVLAILSGAITSGMGYALWYQVLPKLNPAIAATAQLSVPILAMAMGWLFLGESLSMRGLLATVFVVSGIAVVSFASLRPQK